MKNVCLLNIIKTFFTLSGGAPLSIERLGANRHATLQSGRSILRLPALVLRADGWQRVAASLRQHQDQRSDRIQLCYPWSVYCQQLRGDE